MKISKRLQMESAFVEGKLGSSVICTRCGATLDTYADACSADLADPCPGFMTIENVRAEFNQAPTVKH